MKNVCLIILSLLIVNGLFAQTKKTKSSISITHEEKRFSLDAHFSETIDDETKLAIVEEVSSVLKLEPEVRSNNAYVWEDNNVEHPSYIFRLNEKRCKIKIIKKGLSHSRYDRLCELGVEVGELLSERSKKVNERGEQATRITKSKTKSHTNAEAKSESDGFLNLAIASSDRGESTSVSISENKKSLKLSSTFSEGMKDVIVKKIKLALNDTSTDDFEKQIWKDTKADGYRIELKNKSCKIKLNKKTLSASEFENLEQLCVDIANIVSNGKH